MNVSVPSTGAKYCQIVASASLIGLIVLCLAWETQLAPLRPGGSWLMLKVLPLLAPLRGILHGRRYTFQWSCMLILAYFTEGVVRAWSEAPPSSTLAVLEILLSVLFFFSAIYYTRFAATDAGKAKAAP